MEPTQGAAQRDAAQPVELRLRPGQALKRPELARLRQAARDFESVMVEHMLKTMRQSFPKGGVLPAGPGRSLYQDLADEQLGRAISRGGGLGLGDVLIRGLTRAGQQKASSPPSTRPINEREASRSERGPR
jgi:peptidoglycan hydrolase FlgJ